MPNFMEQFVFQCTQKVSTVDIAILKQDTLISPGANAQFTLQLTNHCIDTLWFKQAAIAPKNWTLIQSQNELFILPQSKRNFTVIASSSSYTPAGKYHFDLGIELLKNYLRFSVHDSVTVSSRTQIIAYPLRYPRKISNHSGATLVQFAVENNGNTTEAMEVFLLGNGGAPPICCTGFACWKTWPVRKNMAGPSPTGVLVVCFGARRPPIRSDRSEIAKGE